MSIAASLPPPARTRVARTRPRSSAWLVAGLIFFSTLPLTFVLFDSEDGMVYDPLWKTGPHHYSHRFLARRKLRAYLPVKGFTRSS